jgi:FkbM family methyltransferase
LHVVAVEANAELVKLGRKRFADAIDRGRLQLLNAAVIGSQQRKQANVLMFYPHPQRSEWGSVDQRWVRRNAEAHGMPHGDPVSVQAVSLQELVHAYGCPNHLKIDIEGADEAVLLDLEQLSILPRSVSWETGKESLSAVLEQHRRLAALGYGRFRVVQQAYLERQKPFLCPDGALWHWEPGCSGALPLHSAQPWRSLRWVQLQYRWLFLTYGLVGPRSGFRWLARHECRWLGVMPRKLQRWADRRGVPLPGWVDTHALLH